MDQSKMLDLTTPKPGVIENWISNQPEPISVVFFYVSTILRAILIGRVFKENGNGFYCLINHNSVTLLDGLFLQEFTMARQFMVDKYFFLENKCDLYFVHKDL